MIALPRLIVKFNNSATNEPCFCCDTELHPSEAAVEVMTDTYRLVCDRCARRIAPELLQARDAQRQTRREAR